MTMGARQQHFKLALNSANWFFLMLSTSTKMLHTALHLHNTLTFNHTSPTPPPRPHFTSSSSTLTPLHTDIPVLTINSLFHAQYWASSQQPLRKEQPFTFTQNTPFTLTNNQSPLPSAKYIKEPCIGKIHVKSCDA